MPFLETLRGLSQRNKIIAGAAVAAVVALLAGMVVLSTRTPMALLYAGVDAQAAGEILAALDAEGVPYTVEGERILVAADARDRLRLTLASQGLPKQSVTGYELLDSMNGFSTTSNMFTAAYWRAKEGELTRTILSMPGVSAARVHIGAEEPSLFSRSGPNRTASVTVTAPAGLNDGQVRAIQHVTALAVAGLKPEDVVIADTQRGLLTPENGDAMSSALDQATKRERALAADLTRLLEARVGRGNARVSVSMSIDTSQEEVAETAVDPASAVVTNRRVSEATSTESGTENAVTVASDLPDGDAAAGERQSQTTENTEQVTYAVSKRDVLRQRGPGRVERLTIAVLLNHLPAPAPSAPPVSDDADNEEGSTVTTQTIPRSREEMESLRGLIEAAAGVDPARGDVVRVETLPFDPIPSAEILSVAETTPIKSFPAEVWQLAQIAVLGAVALLLGLFVVKPVMAPATTEAAEAAAGTADDSVVITDPVAMLRHASAEAPDAAGALLNAWLDQEKETI